jgi:hypothetical protein
MSACNFTTQINGTDCIGDSRGIINQNFISLDNAVCALSGSTFLRGANYGLEQGEDGNARLIQPLRSVYNFYPDRFNASSNPYNNRMLATYSGINADSAPFESPVQTLQVIPVVLPFTVPVDAVLVKIRVKALFQRPDGNLTLKTRRSAGDEWYTILQTAATGPADTYRADETTTEILYHNKSTGALDWIMYDTGTGTLNANASYEVIFEILGYYFTVDPVGLT